jgi:hypothetical protein
MVINNDDYNCYDVTVSVTFHVEAKSEDSALDVVSQAMNKTNNFYIVRNADLFLSEAKVTKLDHKTIYHSN